jgi:hypothetical protein
VNHKAPPHKLVTVIGMSSSEKEPLETPRFSSALWLLFNVYKSTLSPLFALFGARCRFHPECSRYAVDAIERHGWIRGAAYGLCRILRCNPLFPGGPDPVP